MHIFYVSYWPFESGLSQSTVIPVINYWLQEGLVTRVTLITPETEDLQMKDEGSFCWQPLKVNTAILPNHSLIRSVVFIWKAFLAAQRTADVKMIWARGSPAGGAAYLLARWLKMPFGVESYEPHSLYMLEGNIWNMGDLSFKLQRKIEKTVFKKAKTLVTVSSHFNKELNAKGRNEGLFNIPCCIPFHAFSFSQSARLETRKKLTIPSNASVGIYVGKFGDIYYNDEFFTLLKQLFDARPDYHHILLTPMAEAARAQAKKYSLPAAQLHILEVPNHEVSQYLSAADIAFCPVKQSPSKLHCSPIKTAEYLANGLPIVISEGIGEDSDWIQRHDLGLVLDFEDETATSPDRVFDLLISSTTLAQERAERAKLAAEWRDISQQFIGYREILNK